MSDFLQDILHDIDFFHIIECDKEAVLYRNDYCELEEGKIMKKDIDFVLLIAGLAICAVIGIITLLLFQNASFSGMCIIAAAIVYSSSLQSKDS
jgi:hypothetical protein